MAQPRSWRRYRDTFGGGNDDVAPAPVRAYAVEYTDRRGHTQLVGRRVAGRGLITLAGSDSQPYKPNGNVNQAHRKRARGRVADAEPERRR